MCGLLSQGAFGLHVRPLYGDFSAPYDCSHLFIAVDVAHFCDVDLFRRQVTEAAERIRGGKRAPGVDQLFTPGQPEWQRRQRANGRVCIDPAVVAMLKRLADELGVPADPLQNTTKDMRHA
jgi:LDH2 family malate/lactate/ureidoglycolate dehydrogenase